MRKRLLNMLILSICVTIFGFLLDDDTKEPSTIMRFVEFFAMTAIIFTFITISHYTFNFVKKRFLLSKN